MPEVAEVLPYEKDIPTIPKLFKSLDPVGSLMLNPEEFERGESCEGYVRRGACAAGRGAARVLD